MNLDVAGGTEGAIDVTVRISSSPDGLSPGDPDPLLFEVEVAIAAQAKVREFVLDEVVLELRNGQRIPAAGALPLKLVRRVVVADKSASAKEGGGSVTIGNDDVADSAAASPIVSSGSGGGGGSRTGASPQEKKIASSSNGGGAVVVHLCPGESIVVHAHFSIPAPSHARYESQLLKKCKTLHLFLNSSRRRTTEESTPAPSPSPSSSASSAASASPVPPFSVQVPFNLERIRRFYKGFAPGYLRELELDDDGQPRWGSGVRNGFVRGGGYSDGYCGDDGGDDGVAADASCSTDYDNSFDDSFDDSFGGGDDEFDAYDDEKHMAGYYYEVMVVGTRGPGDWINSTTEYCVEVATNTIEAVSVAVESEFRELYAANTIADDGVTTLNPDDIAPFRITQLAVAGSSQALTAQTFTVVPHGAALEVNVSPGGDGPGTWPVPLPSNEGDTKKNGKAEEEEEEEERKPTLEVVNVVSPPFSVWEDVLDDIVKLPVPHAVTVAEVEAEAGVCDGNNASSDATSNDDDLTETLTPITLESAAPALLPGVQRKGKQAASSFSATAVSAEAAIMAAPAAPAESAAMFAMARAIAVAASTPAGAAAIAATHAAECSSSSTAAGGVAGAAMKTAPVKCAWTKHLSAEHNNTPFYRNELTQTSVWVEPEEYRFFVAQQQLQLQNCGDSATTGREVVPLVPVVCGGGVDAGSAGAVADTSASSNVPIESCRSAAPAAVDAPSSASTTLILQVCCAENTLAETSRAVQELVMLPSKVVDADRVIERLVAAVLEEDKVAASATQATAQTSAARTAESETAVGASVNVSTTPLGALAALRALLVRMRPGKGLEPHTRNSKLFFEANGDATILQRLARLDVCEQERVATLRCLSVLLFAPTYASKSSLLSSRAVTGHESESGAGAAMLSSGAIAVLTAMAKGERSLFSSASMAAGILDRAGRM